jgi:tetratricopeptide (TPR) repeat protein
VEELTMAVDRRGSAFRYIIAGAILVVGLFPDGTAAQTQQQIDWCVNSESLFSYDLQIGGCTAVIQSGQGSTLYLPLAFHSRAYAYYKKDEYQDAIADFSEAIRLDPTDAQALNGRCWMRAIVGRELRQALEDCNESLRLRANDAPTLDSRGFTCLKLGQLNHSISDYDGALGLDPTQAESYYGRGVAKLKKGDGHGGNADIAAAKVIQADIAEVFAKYGIRLDDGVVSNAPATSTSGADCARPVAHWKSPDDLKTLAVREDHLSRFANLN